MRGLPRAVGHVFAQRRVSRQAESRTAHVALAVGTDEILRRRSRAAALRSRRTATAPQGVVVRHFDRCNPRGVPSISVTPVRSISGRRISCSRGFSPRAAHFVDKPLQPCFRRRRERVVGCRFCGPGRHVLEHDPHVDDSAVPAIGSSSACATSAQYSRCIAFPARRNEDRQRSVYAPSDRRRGIGDATALPWDRSLDAVEEASMSNARSR